MSQKLGKLIGMSLSDFEKDDLRPKEIQLREARLIPMHKPGDEMALTSIFLSSLRLIKEFRREISSAINLASTGTIHVYTEVTFGKFPDKRIDGLILVVRGNKIKDAALLELKNKNCELDATQIQDYLEIAKYYSIPRLITVSNQFVSIPTQSPVSVKLPKAVSLYHLSWSYIRTIASLLLFDNEMNINDPDQVEIMNEVMKFFEDDNSGVCGFTSMKPGWREVAQRTNSGALLRSDDTDVDEAVCSWLQEEKDMALILSRKLGLLVQSGEKKYRSNLQARIDSEKKMLVDNSYLLSTLSVAGAVSSIHVRANFDRRNIVMCVTLSPPQDRGTKAQITWVRNQLKRCHSRNPELFDSMREELRVGIGIKFTSKRERLTLDSIETAWERLVGREIKDFTIVQVKDLGRNFSSRKGFIVTIEDMLLKYYQGIVQHLKSWTRPAPKMVVKKSQPVEDLLDE